MYRRKVLVDKVAERLFNLIPKAALRYRAEVMALEIRPDHVHLLVEVDPQFGIHRLESRGSRVENKRVTGKTFIRFRGPQAL